MTTLREDLGYMRAAASDAVIILGDDTLEALASNRIQQTSLCYLMIVVGEMATRIHQRGETSLYPGIGWAGLSGMRNVLAHQPEKTDFSEVRRVIIEEYPPLIVAIDAILRELI